MASTITESMREHYDRIVGLSEPALDMACSYVQDRFNIVRLAYGRRDHKRTSDFLRRVERVAGRGARHRVPAVAVRGEGRLLSCAKRAGPGRTHPVASARRAADLGASASAG